MEELRIHYDVSIGMQFETEIASIREAIGRKPFNQRDSTFGVAGNTFRAYRNHPERPSKVYRDWASDICNPIDAERLSVSIDCPGGFNNWHLSLAESLQTYWSSEQRSNLSFAHLYKLVDLFIKWLSSHSFNSTNLHQILAEQANCALDSQTLQKINQCLSMALPLSKPSMGDIHSRVTYDFCQRIIGDFAKTYGGTRLLFDYFAWRKGGPTLSASSKSGDDRRPLE